MLLVLITCHTSQPVICTTDTVLPDGLIIPGEGVFMLDLVVECYYTSSRSKISDHMLLAYVDQ